MRFQGPLMWGLHEVEGFGVQGPNVGFGGVGCRVLGLLG